MRRFLRLAAGCAVLGLLGLPAESSAQPSRWSMHRLSGGVQATGAIIEQGGARTSALLPGLVLGYSVASNLAAGATLEHDFAGDLTILSAGGRVKILDTQRGDIAVGASVVSYSGDGALSYPEETSWTASVHGAWSAAKGKAQQTTLYAIASGSWDVENDVKTYRIGLRAPLFGGLPWER